MGKRKKWNADRVVSISAIIVSVATLIMILYQTNLMRQEQRASVMPSLSIGYNVNIEAEQFSEKIYLLNNGLGPAFIKKFLIIKGDKIHKGDLYSYFEDIDNNSEAESVKRYPNEFILPKEERILLHEKKSDSTSKVILGRYFKYYTNVINIKNDIKEKAIIEIYYENIYGDRWKISSDRSVPVALD